MFNKKGQVNKVFVFVFSVIVILFAAFLVVKFVTAFLDDSTKVYEQKFFDLAQKNYDSVLKTYGSEKVYNYKVSNRVKLVCFVSKPSCLDTDAKVIGLVNNVSTSALDNMKALAKDGDNIILFDDSDVLESNKVGDFIVKNTGCFCIVPSSSNWFKVIFENYQNKVVVDVVYEFD